MSGRQSKGTARRIRKRREGATKLEVKAFKHGMHTCREAVIPGVKRRAALTGGGIGLVLGVLGTVAAYAVLGW